MKNQRATVLTSIITDPAAAQLADDDSAAAGIVCITGDGHKHHLKKN